MQARRDLQFKGKFYFRFILIVEKNCFYDETLKYEFIFGCVTCKKIFLADSVTHVAIISVMMSMRNTHALCIIRYKIFVGSWLEVLKFIWIFKNQNVRPNFLVKISLSELTCKKISLSWKANWRCVLGEVKQENTFFGGSYQPSHLLSQKKIFSDSVLFKYIDHFIG